MIGKVLASFFWLLWLGFGIWWTITHQLLNTWAFWVITVAFALQLGIVIYNVSDLLSRRRMLRRFRSGP